MKEIKLTQGKFALVDDDDFERLNQMYWHVMCIGNTFYARGLLKINGKSCHKKILMHRMIINPPDNMSIDHINHNGLDNRKENLRVVTHRQNHWNRVDGFKNKLGYIGVGKNGNYYQSRININGKKYYLGTYKTVELAHEAYIKKYNEIKDYERK